MEEWVIAVSMLVAGLLAVARVAGWRGGERVLGVAAKVLDKVKSMVVKPRGDEDDVK